MRGGEGTRGMLAFGEWTVTLGVSAREGTITVVMRTRNDPQSCGLYRLVGLTAKTG